MTPEAIEDLARSGITPEDAERAGMYCVDNAKELFEDFENAPALVLPYYAPDGQSLLTFEREDEAWEFARVRYLSPPTAHAGTFTKKKFQRYGQPKASGIQVYLPLLDGILWSDILDDASMPLVITEGEKKALKGCIEGYATLGLGGVFNWADGEELVPILENANWKGRKVYIVFDSDAVTNSNVRASEARLSVELGLKRGADVYIVRIPQTDDNKLGMDDYIVKFGDALFANLLQATPPARKIDIEVAKLNQDVCWIDKEARVYVHKTGTFLHKGDFTKGSEFSTRTVLQPAKKGSGVVEVSVADKWLTHPFSIRHNDIVMDPRSTDPITVNDDGSTNLNTWRGFVNQPGDVSMFKELTEHVFKGLPPEHRDFALKLAAYKFQNPDKMVGMAVVLVGANKGTGKTMWADCIRLAAGKYGRSAKSSDLSLDYNGFVENAMVVVFNEAEPRHMNHGAQNLKGYITDSDQTLNVKHRVIKQIKTYGFYIITANDLRVGNTESDDRRMLVVEVHDKHPDGKEGFYAPIGRWLKSGEAGPAIAHYLMNYPLNGWEPPEEPPMTSEKFQAYYENLSPVGRLAHDMKTSEHNMIAMWISASLDWARQNEMSNNSQLQRQAQSILAANATFPIRPFYTPEELALMFPMIAETLHGNRRGALTSGEISKQLRNHGIRYLQNIDSPYGFRHRGRNQQYLVIADLDNWKEPITQKQFDLFMKECPQYKDHAAAQKQQALRKSSKLRRAGQ